MDASVHRCVIRGMVPTLFLLSMLLFPGSRSVAAPSQNTYVQEAPLVLALYYTWFDETTWTYDSLSDLPIQPYVSRDRGLMARHIEQAQAAGIDAFLVAWYGPSGQFNQTEPNLVALLEEAAVRNFRIGILFETDSPFFSGIGDVTQALHHATGVHMAQPAYLRTAGRPVLFFWRPQIYDVGTWSALRGQVDPGKNTFWVSEGVDTGFLSVFDGHYLYSNTWNPAADLTTTNQKFATWVNSAGDQSGTHKVWAATVMPGYDDVRIRPGSGFRKEREGGAYYVRGWQAAMASSPDWIVINSFNEWPEGTYIEPSQGFSDTYLALTAEWSRRFKAGISAPDLAAATQTESVQAAEIEATTTEVVAREVSEPLIPTAVVEASLLNARTGPGLEYDVLFILGEGAALPVLAQDAADPAWLQVDFSGQSVWIAAEFVRLVGPIEEIAIAGSRDDGSTTEAALTGFDLDFVWPYGFIMPEEHTYFPQNRP